MEDFAAKEFKAICENVQRRKRYDLELVLRVANFKSQATLCYEPDKGEDWKSVVQSISGQATSASGGFKR